MSEGIQGNTSRQPSYQNQQQQHQSAASTNENSAEQETVESQQLLRGPARSFVASPGVGALLVEAYAKVVLKKQNRLSPNKVLFEYARFLVSSLAALLHLPTSCASSFHLVWHSLEYRCKQRKMVSPVPLFASTYYRAPVIALSSFALAIK